MPPTTADIIASAVYLEDDYNPRVLTVSHLMGILHHHGIHYPSNAKKDALLSLFNENITGNLDTLRRNRDILDGSQASDAGITDGLTGVLISERDAQTTGRRPRRPKKTVSARTSAEPSAEPTRRSVRRSAEPSTATRKTGTRERVTEPIVIEDSESEEDALPVRPTKTSKKTVSKPRVSLGEDSGWEENNVFQSGPDDTPIAKSSRNSSTRKSRKPSSSATPSSPLPVTSTLETATPAPSKPRRKAGLSRRADPPIGPDLSVGLETRALDSTRQVDLEPAEALVSSSVVGDEAESGDNHDDPISEDLRGLSPNSERSPTYASKKSRIFPTFKWIIVVASLAAVSNSVHSYKVQSSTIGYCDAGTNSNGQLRALRAERQAITECNTQLIRHGPDIPHTRLINGTECPLEPFLPAPDSCTPCPRLAHCLGNKVKCKGAYIFEEHPFARVGVSPLFDGLPGLSPIAFPPACVENRERIHEVGKLGKSIVNYLAKVKGQLLCEGRGRHIKGSDVQVLGLEKGQLRAIAKSWIRKQIPSEQQDPLFDDALQRLEGNGLIVTELDPSGRTWIAGMREDMGLVCKAKISLIDAWDVWRGYLYGLLFLVLLSAYGRHRITARRIESLRVAELVKETLDMLRDQEYAHHTDPVRAPYSFIAPVNLRDHILKDIHSLAERRRIWSQVERVVEANSNVRANAEEVNGDEIVVWRWVGASGVSPRRLLDTE